MKTFDQKINNLYLYPLFSLVSCLSGDSLSTAQRCPNTISTCGPGQGACLVFCDEWAEILPEESQPQMIWYAGELESPGESPAGEARGYLRCRTSG